MKKFALLAGLGLILFMSSCAKDDLLEIENMAPELTKKEKDTPNDNEWDKHSKNNGTDSTLYVHTVFSDGKQ